MVAGMLELNNAGMDASTTSQWPHVSREYGRASGSVSRPLGWDGASASDSITQRFPTTSLTSKHREEFYASGLTDATIAAAGLRSVDTSEVMDILGWSPKHTHWGTGWAIPYRFPDESHVTYTRVKLDYPRHDERGRPTKYESARGRPNRPYFPPGFWDAWHRGDEVIITEGEKKALKATQEGFACIGLVGVYGFQRQRMRDDQGRKYGKTELITDLARLNWKGRRVVIAYDSDGAQKEGVRHAEAKLAEVLGREGAQVRVARLPGGPGKKCGLDDYLVEHGADALRAVLAAGARAELPRKLDAIDWAKMLLEDEFDDDRGRMLRWWRDEFHLWNGKHYYTRSDNEMEAIVLKWLHRHGAPAKPCFARDVLKCLKAEAHVYFDWDRPVWLNDQKADASCWLAMDDGLINLTEMLTRGESDPAIRRAHTPQFFSPCCLPYPFDSVAECPTWTRFVGEVLKDDQQIIDLLQEWFGYNLVFDTSMHAFMLMIGEGANGKSVVLEVLEALLGRDNVSHVDLEAFGERFQLGATIGKLANIISEVGELTRPNEATFKKFVGGDRIQIDRKNKEAVQVSPTARVTVATNIRPKWQDRSNGIWRRMLLIPFDVSIPLEKQDRTLAKRIIATELPGVFRWAVAGLVRLKERGQFTSPTTSAELVAEYKAETNPAREYLLSECEADLHSRVRAESLYQHYRDWCQSHGHYAMATNTFGTEIRRAFPDVRVAREMENGRKVRVYYGIRIGVTPDSPSF